jgi:glycosyltransferase involved in cell wall biosynthesis
MQLAVTHLAHGEIFGGAERQLLTLARGLAQVGVRVTVELFWNRQLAQELRSAGIDVRIASTRELLPVLRRRPKREVCHIMHSHGTRGTVLAYLRGGGPLVYTEHGLPWSDPERPFRTARAGAIRTLEQICLVAARATLVYVTADLASRRPVMLSRLPFQVIYNGADLPDGKSLERPPELRPDRFNVVFAGRLEPVKGPLEAIETLRLLPQDSRAHLFVLGAGPLEADAIQRVRAANLERRVSLLGFRKDAQAYIAHADAVLMPSAHEGLPFTAIEALGFGVPLVASDVGGLHETLRHRETALLVPAGKPSRFAAALHELERDTALCRVLATNGIHLQRTHLSAGAMLTHYLNLYHSTLGTGSPRARLNRS